MAGKQGYLLSIHLTPEIQVLGGLWREISRLVQVRELLPAPSQLIQL